MKTSTKLLSIAAAAVALGTGGLVFAQAGHGIHGRMAGGAGMQQGTGMHGGAQDGMRGGMGAGMQGAGQPAEAAARLATAKTDLKITAAQEPAWQAFETVVRQQIEARQALRTGMQTRMQDPAAAATFDRTAQREAMMKLRGSEQAARDTARQALYAVLTPEQKALADQKLGAGPGHRMGAHRRAG